MEQKPDPIPPGITGTPLNVLKLARLNAIQDKVIDMLTDMKIARDNKAAIKNLNNFNKYVLSFCKPGANAMLQVYRWMYNRTGIPEDFIDHFTDLPLEAKAEFLIEIQHLQDMKEDKTKINSLSESLLFKLIKYATSSSKLAPPDDAVWTANCHPDKTDELEHLLYLINHGRDDIRENTENFKQLSDNEISDACRLFSHRFPSIIQQAGMRIGINKTELDSICDGLVTELERIRDEPDVMVTDRDTLLRSIREDLMIMYKRDLGRGCKQQMTDFDPNADETKGELSSKSQVLLIKEGTGLGKQCLKRFLFYRWLSGTNMQSPDTNSAYDVVFKMTTNVGTCSDISDLIDNNLPEPCHQFASNDIDKMKKLMKEFKIIWVLDGFDDCHYEPKKDDKKGEEEAEGGE